MGIIENVWVSCVSFFNVVVFLYKWGYIDIYGYGVSIGKIF